MVSSTSLRSQYHDGWRWKGIVPQRPTHFVKHYFRFLLWHYLVPGTHLIIPSWAREPNQTDHHSVPAPHPDPQLHGDVHRQHPSCWILVTRLNVRGSGRCQIVCVGVWKEQAHVWGQRWRRPAFGRPAFANGTSMSLMQTSFAPGRPKTGNSSEVSSTAAKRSGGESIGDRGGKDKLAWLAWLVGSGPRTPGANKCSAARDLSGDTTCRTPIGAQAVVPSQIRAKINVFEVITDPGPGRSDLFRCVGNTSICTARLGFKHSHWRSASLQLPKSTVLQWVQRHTSFL